MLPMPTDQLVCILMAESPRCKNEFKIQRPILVDDIGGRGHTLYGKLPNMTYVIARGGKVLFRADWTDAATIELVIDYILSAKSLRSEGVHLEPFYVELVGYHRTDNGSFRDGLLRAGQQSMADFERVTKRWKEHGLAMTDSLASLITLYNRIR